MATRNKMDMILRLLVIFVTWRTSLGRTEIRNPDFVWKDAAFAVTCARIPTLSDSTMVLMRNGRPVQEQGFTSILLRDVKEPDTPENIDQLIASKANATYTDADTYTCYTCYGARQNNCPDGAMETDSGSILVGRLLPDVRKHYVAIPGGFNLTLEFTGPGNMESVNWLIFHHDVSKHGFTEEHGFFQEDGFNMEYYRMIAPKTDYYDQGEYQVMFKRRLTNETHSTGYRFITIYTYGMTTSNATQVEDGSDLSLFCQIIDRNAVFLNELNDNTINWEFEGRDVRFHGDIKDRVRVDTSDFNTNLTVVSADARVAGKYTCVYDFTMFDGSTYIKRHTIEVKGPPYIEAIEGDTSYTTEETMILTAKIGGYPPPVVTWYKDGVQLFESPTVRFESDPETGVYRLIVSDLEGTAAGDYSVKAVSQGWPDATDAVEIDVVPSGNLRPPYIDDIKGATSYTTGDNLVLTAKVGGYPSPEVTWYKDGVRLLESPNIRFEYNPTTGVYSLTKTNIEETDGGRYSIRATSPGQTTATSAVDVDVKESNTRPPYVRGIDGDTDYQADDDLNLVCMAGGSPVPEVTWYKDGVKLLESTKIRFHSNPEEKEYRLIVTDLSLADKGRYSCMASGPDGSVAEKFVDVLIQDCGDTCPPYIGGIDGDSSYQTEDDLELICRAGGSPVPEVKWYKDGVKLEESPDIQFESDPDAREYRLSVTNLRESDKGSYTCRATASDGTMAESTTEIYVSTCSDRKGITLSKTYWIIALVVGITILLINIVCCCVCCYQRQDREKKVASLYIARGSQDSGFEESVNQENNEPNDFPKSISKDNKDNEPIRNEPNDFLKSILKGNKEIEPIGNEPNDFPKSILKGNRENEPIGNEPNDFPKSIMKGNRENEPIERVCNTEHYQTHVIMPDAENNLVQNEHLDVFEHEPPATKTQSPVIEDITIVTPVRPLEGTREVSRSSSQEKKITAPTLKNQIIEIPLMESKVGFDPKANPIISKEDDNPITIESNISGRIIQTQRRPRVYKQRVNRQNIHQKKRGVTPATIWSDCWEPSDMIPEKQIIPRNEPRGTRKHTDYSIKKNDKPKHRVQSPWFGIGKRTLLLGAPRAVLWNEPVYYRPYWRDGYGWDYSAEYGDFSQEVRQTTHTWDAV